MTSCGYTQIKKVILKGGEDTSTYDATFTEDEIENLEKKYQEGKRIS